MGICSTGIITPDKNICGARTMGMNWTDLKLVVGKAGDEYAQADRYGDDKEEDSADLPEAAAVVDIQRQDGEGEDDGGLHNGKDEEAQHVAKHDVEPSDKGRLEAFERSLRALPEESDAGEDKGEEQHEHRQKARSNPVKDGALLVEAEPDQRHDYEGTDDEQSDGAPIAQYLSDDTLSDCQDAVR